MVQSLENPSRCASMGFLVSTLCCSVWGILSLPFPTPDRQSVDKIQTNARRLNLEYTKKNWDFWSITWTSPLIVRKSRNMGIFWMFSRMTRMTQQIWFLRCSSSTVAVANSHLGMRVKAVTAWKVRFRRKLYVLFMLYNIRFYYNITYMLLYTMLCHVIIVNYDYDIQFTYIYKPSLYRVIVYIHVFVWHLRSSWHPGLTYLHLYPQVGRWMICSGARTSIGFPIWWVPFLGSFLISSLQTSPWEKHMTSQFWCSDVWMITTCLDDCNVDNFDRWFG